MKVHWTRNAIDQLVNTYEYISLNSPTCGKQMVGKITRRSEQIADHPLSGRKVPEYEAQNIRELIEISCGIIDRIRQDQIKQARDISRALNFLFFE